MAIDLVSFGLFSLIVLLAAIVTSIIALLISFPILLTSTIRQTWEVILQSTTGSTSKFKLSNLEFMLLYISGVPILVYITILLTLPFIWFVYIQVGVEWYWIITPILLLSAISARIFRKFSYENDVGRTSDSSTSNYIVITIYWTIVYLIGSGGALVSGFFVYGWI